MSKRGVLPETIKIPTFAASNNPRKNGKRQRQNLRADQVSFLRGKVREQQQQLEEAQKTNKQNRDKLERLYKLMESSQAEQKKLLAIIERLQSQLAVGKKMHFGSKRVKGIDWNLESKGRDDDKEDFDGTSESLTQSVKEKEASKTSRQNKGNSRKGSTYKTLWSVRAV